MDGLQEGGKITRKNLEACKITEIKLTVDGIAHPEIVGCVLGYVGSLQQGTVCQNGHPATNHTLPGE